MKSTPRPARAVLSGILALAALTSAPAVAQVCGNGIVEPPEECDDGAAFRLDGCAPDCTYEHVQRMTALALGDGPGPSSCTPATNAFGSAFSSAGLTALNAQLATVISDQTLNQLLQIVALDDPAGVDDPDLAVGFLGSAFDARGPAPGLDAWYIAEPVFLDPDDLPAVSLPGSVLARELSAGPGRVEIRFLEGLITARDARISAVVGSLTGPPGPPPDQLAPGFAAFESLAADDGNHGMCGNLTVASLALVPLPAEFAAGGSAECSSLCPGSRDYTWCGAGNPVGPGCNSLLDLMVGGCAFVPPLCIGIVTPTQPDVGTGGQPPVVLVADPTSGKVTVVEPEDAYSTWFEFASQRVHMTNHVGGIFTDGFESSDLAAWSSSYP
jgi:cysteine-rich repeat protein